MYDIGWILVLLYLDELSEKIIKYSKEYLNHYPTASDPSVLVQKYLYTPLYIHGYEIVLIKVLLVEIARF